MAARSISPVEICGISYSLEMNWAWVPLPAPGGPSKIIRIIIRLSLIDRILGLIKLRDWWVAELTLPCGFQKLKYF